MAIMIQQILKPSPVDLSCIEVWLNINVLQYKIINSVFLQI